MINDGDILNTCRDIDALNAEHEDYEGYWNDRDVDINGLMTAAEQRALGLAMMITGQRPSQASSIVLPEEVAQLLPAFSTMFADGFACGLTLARKEAGHV